MEMFKNFSFVQDIARQIIQPRPCNYLALDIWKNIKNKNLYHYECPHFQMLNERTVSVHMIENQTHKNTSNPSLSTCIVYLHGLSSFSVEGTFMVENLERHFADLNVSICLFDLRGHGRDKAQNITFGLKQSKQLYQLLLFLKNERNYHQFILWGRSMGATTILKMVHDFNEELTSNQINLKYLVLDSAFSSIQKVATEIISKKSGMPQIFCKPVFDYFISAVQKLHNINLTVDITTFRNIQTDALFLYSDIDNLVSSQHSKTLYNKYPGPKDKIEMNIGHNDQRPEPVLNSVFEKLKNSLKNMPNLQRRRSLSTKKSGLSVTKSRRVQTHQYAQTQTDHHFQENFYQVKTEENKENLKNTVNKINSQTFSKYEKQNNQTKNLLSKNSMKNSPKPFKIAKDQPKQLKLSKKFITLNGNIKNTPQLLKQKVHINHQKENQQKKQKKLKISHKNLIEDEKAKLFEENPRQKTSIYQNSQKSFKQATKEIRPQSNYQKIDDYSRFSEAKSAFLIRNAHEPFSNISQNIKESYMRKKYHQNEMIRKKLSINQSRAPTVSNCCIWDKYSVSHPVQKPQSDFIPAYVQRRPESAFQTVNVSLKDVKTGVKMNQKRHSQNIRNSINVELLKNEHILSIHQSCILSSNTRSPNPSQKVIFNFNSHEQMKMNAVHGLSHQNYL